jgi:hypothetical protein
MEMASDGSLASMPEQWTLLWREGKKTWLQLEESSVFFREEGNYELYG